MSVRVVAPDAVACDVAANGSGVVMTPPSAAAASPV
jgi:hypothetical protein